MVCSCSLWETRHGSWTHPVCVMLRVHRATKWHLLSFAQHSSCCFPMFYWLFLAADAHWVDNLRQLLTATSGSLSWAVMASSIISIEKLWFGLFSSTCVTLHLSTLKLLCQQCAFCSVLWDPAGHCHWHGISLPWSGQEYPYTWRFCVLSLLQVVNEDVE